MAALQTPDLY